MLAFQLKPIDSAERQDPTSRMRHQKKKKGIHVHRMYFFFFCDEYLNLGLDNKSDKVLFIVSL